MTQSILSIQSQIVYGHAGNSAARFPMERLGVETLILPTVLFSNHTGYKHHRGRVLESSEVSDLLLGLEELHIFPKIDGIVLGYLGSAENASPIIETVKKIKIANSKAVFVCDPVMGDTDQGLYVDAAVPAVMPKLIAVADAITPNQWEFEKLIGKALLTRNQAIKEAKDYLLAYPSLGTVVITSLQTKDIDPTTVENLVITRTGVWTVATPRIDRTIVTTGTGDILSAMFTAFLIQGVSPQTAVARCVSSIYEILTHMVPEDTELPIVRFQQAFVQPAIELKAEKL